MTENPTARRFIDALQRLESARDAEPMVALHADDAELRNPMLAEPRRGRDGARSFWEAYRHSFADVESTFRHVAGRDDASLLEWTSRGRLPDGTPFAHDGVSVVEWDGGAVRRFRTYFDPSDLQRRASPADGG